VDSLFPDFDLEQACSTLLEGREQEGITRIYTILRKGLQESVSGTGLYPTPISLAHFMVEIAQPQPGETIYDPACGLCSFFVEACRYLKKPADQNISNVFLGYDINPHLLETGKAWMKANGIDTSRIQERDLFDNCDDYSDQFKGRYLILTHPPYEKLVAQPEKESAWTSNEPVEHYDGIFLRHCMDTLRKHPGGRCGIVVSQYFFYNSASKTQRYELAKEYSIHLIIRLPKKLFTTSQRDVNYYSYLIYFDKQGTTGQILRCNIHEDETLSRSGEIIFKDAKNIWKRWQERSFEKPFTLADEEQKYAWIIDAGTVRKHDPEYKLIDYVPPRPEEKPAFSLDELMQRLVEQTGELHELTKETSEDKLTMMRERC